MARFEPLAATAAVLVADQVTKYWARTRLLPAGSSAGGGVRFEYVINRGASWGLGSSWPALAGVAGVAGVLVLLVWLRVWRCRTRGERTWVAVILGGAIGNLTDRFAHGGVTDWIHVAPYPPFFNVADVAIRGGLAAIAVLMLVRWRRGQLRSQASPAEQPR